jgi:hypothetical protein
LRANPRINWTQKRRFLHYDALHAGGSTDFPIIYLRRTGLYEIYMPRSDFSSRNFMFAAPIAEVLCSKRWKGVERWGWRSKG